MSRIFCIALTTVCLLTSAGCKDSVVGGANVENATLVTFDQFQEANTEEKVFWYLGSDAEHQYFRTAKGFYRIPTSSGVVPDGWVTRAKRNFDDGVPVGKLGIHASIRGDGIGVPEENKSKVDYRPLD